MDRRMLNRRVLKIGGSLLRGEAWRGVMDAVAHSTPGRLVIVPGGGVYADAVRSTQTTLGFDDATAHEMAVLAMAQTACVLLGACPRAVRAATVAEIEAAWSQHDIVVWQPTVLPDTPARERHWDYTSDSLAAWLAAQLHAEELALLKSCEWPTPAVTQAGAPQAAEVWQGWSQAGWVDGCFAEQAVAVPGTVRLLSAEQLPAWLATAASASTPMPRAAHEAAAPTPALFEASVPVLRHYLERLAALVDLARAEVREGLSAEADLMQARLSDDMLPWPSQVLIAAQMARRAAFPLAGRPVPAYPGEARDLTELAARLSAIRQDLATLQPAEFAGAEGQMFTERAGDADIRLPAWAFLGQFMLPNFFFHLSMAYAILRQRGVRLGKSDFDGWHRYRDAIR